MFSIVSKIANNKPQGKFLIVLFSTILGLRGRVNFLNLSRYSTYCDRSFRRHFDKVFDFVALNLKLIQNITQPQSKLFIAVDCSYLPKSGKKTYGITRFWSGCLNRIVRGIELSSIAIVDLHFHTAFHVQCLQTPAQFSDGKTRIDFYCNQILNLKDRLMEISHYVVADGFYVKKKFVLPLVEQGFQIISKLRQDANLKFIYKGKKQNKRGRPKKYDGKVAFTNLRRFKRQALDDQNSLYSKVVYSVGLELNVKVVVLKNHISGNYRVFFSTDTELEAYEIFSYYTARFQIEFLFRDAKQYGGLSQCQSTKKQRLNFHHNASLSTINFVKIKLIEDNKMKVPENYPIQQIKRQFELSIAIEQVVEEFDIPRSLIVKHPNYQKFKNLNLAA